jgi:hypothetical protein
MIRSSRTLWQWDSRRASSDPVLAYVLQNTRNTPKKVSKKEQHSSKRRIVGLKSRDAIHPADNPLHSAQLLWSPRGSVVEPRSVVILQGAQ